MTRSPDNKPNPQGKGLTPAVGYLAESSAGMRLPDARDDSSQRIVEDYLSSLFVLSCDFRFMPVKNTVYSIYSHRGKVLLSLVSPEEGGERIYDDYFGECFLNDDFSWSLSLENEAGERLFWAEDVKSPEGGRTDLLSDEEGFGRLIENILSEKLGRRSGKLGYYQNVLNYVLGRSITLRSIRLLESDPQAGEQFQRFLPRLTRI